MACVVAAPVLQPSGDFPAWLEAQGVNAEVARAMDSELGIRDYGVLRACVGDGLVRAELLATARDRLPFGFYAVLRQVVKALQGADTHDGWTTTPPRWDASAVTAPGDGTTGSLVDVLLALFSGLSRELLFSVRRLRAMDDPEMCVDSSTPPTVNVKDEDFVTVKEELPSEEWRTFLSQSELQLEAEKVKEGAASFSEDWRSSEVLSKRTVENQADGCINGRPSEHNVTSMDTATGHIFHTSDLREVGEGSWRGRTAGHQTMLSLQYTIDEAGGGDRAVIPRGEEMPYSCWLCPQTFTLEADLTDHWSVHTGEFPYCCLACGGCFQNADDLSVHERSHAIEKPYCCTVCGQTFSNQSSLKRHHRTHTGEKPFLCGVCGKAFTNKRNMKTHQRVQHAGMALP